ncbi:MAG: thioredoxin family protein, partial [Cytophagaceae bacterium]|nr:thioredoxin family protein [Cytophagaceae bacterium]
MRKTLFYVSFLLLQVSAMGQGTNFVQGNLRTVFDQAKAANKSVFIEIFSPSCHVCASFVPTFENVGVGKFYNEKFVSYRLDVNSQEAQGFLTKQRIFVPSLPLLMYFDKDVSLLHALNVNNTTNDVIAAAGNALNPTSRAASYKSRYQRGERNPGFLIEYGYFSRIVRDTISNMAAVNDYVKTQPASAYASTTNFLVLQKLVMDTDNPLFQYFVNHIGDFQKKNDPKIVRDVAEGIIMSTLFSGRAAKFTPANVRTLGTYLTKIGLDKRTVENRTLVPELTALMKVNQAAQAVERANRYLSGPAGPREAIYLAKFITDHTNDAAALNAAQGWLNRYLSKPATTSEEKRDLAKQLS